MKNLSLNGEWAVRKANTDFVIPANVPGDIYSDLLRNKKIPDPYHRDNEKELQWIGKSDWLYSRCFFIDKSLLCSDIILLHCEGLDTLATVEINGKKIAESDNMFRVYEWNIKEYLNAGQNEISILFKSAYEYCKKLGEKVKKLPCAGQEEGYDQNWFYHKPHKLDVPLSWIRKEQCNFGWDWGPMLLTCGIWKNIEITAYDSVRFSDIYIGQNHNNRDVDLDVNLHIENPDNRKIFIRLHLEFENKTVTELTASTDKSFFSRSFTITNPQLWWPNGLGRQHLYTVKAELADEKGAVIDNLKKHFGLRTVRLIRQKDEWGESFKFSVNGIEIFMKGANWIPADAIPANIPDNKYKKLLGDAAKANMNMIRLWGGGIYEKDIFYDTCDELGLLVWHDFMFASAGYPLFDDNFIKNVEEEVRCNIRRISNHPCLALWCGNNELEMGTVGEKWTEQTMSREDYKKLFDELLPSLVKELSPEIDYWPSSPHSSAGNRYNPQNPDCGDAHLWDVWHGKKPFEWYCSCKHRFISEFGFQSFPEPKTIETFTLPPDRNVTSHIMEYHQRSDIGNSTIIHYMLDWFKLPDGFENTVWVSQILQAMAIKHAVEHWRTNMPRTMGSLYWQLNDTWPGTSWSSIDYYCRWKALHFEAQRFYSQYLICGFTNENNDIDIYIVNDRLSDKKLKATVTVTDMYGKNFYKETINATVTKQTSKKIRTINPVKAAKKLRTNNILVWLQLEKDKKTVSTNLVLLKRPKHLKLHKTAYSIKVNPAGRNSFNVKITSDVPSLWTWFELKNMNADYEDNFFHLPAGETYTVNVKPEKHLSVNEFQNQLLIKNITDTYSL